MHALSLPPPGSEDPLFLAIMDDQLSTVQQILTQSPDKIRLRNSEGDGVLFVATQYGRIEIFDYLLSLETVDLNERDSVQSPVFTTLRPGRESHRHFIRRMIERGVDVNATDQGGDTLLNTALACDEVLEEGLIERGFCVNAQNDHGETPLYLACEGLRLEWVFFLLSHGADCFIANDEGVIPLCSHVFRYQLDEEMTEVVLLYMFSNSEERCSFRSGTMLVAMLDDRLFEMLIDRTDRVEHHSMLSLGFVIRLLLDIRMPCLRLFVERFRSVFIDILKGISLVDLLEEDHYDLSMFLVEEELLPSDFVHGNVPRTDTTVIQSFISHYPELPPATITTTLLTYLSHGTSDVTTLDFELVYNSCGYGELLRVLQRLEVRPVSESKLGYEVWRRSPVPVFLYNMSVRSLPDLDLRRFGNLKDALGYFVSGELFGRCRGRVPMLMELARNAARWFVIERFGIGECRRFYDVVERLPIGVSNQRILTFERKLYR